MDKRYCLARKLRRNSTPQENKLWHILRNRQFYNFKFYRQYPVGKYVVDFVCKEKKFIIELDGGQHNFEENLQKESVRTSFLINSGYKIVRFWNFDIDDNFEGVIAELEKYFA